MNSHQRRKFRREKEREAFQYGAQMIPNPTLKTEFHPMYKGHIENALNTIPAVKVITKPRNPFQRFLDMIRSIFHA